MPEFYDKQGSVISAEEYARLRMHPDYWNVAQDRVKGWLVSTVWLGLDHSFPGLVPRAVHIPIIFETMVFPPESSFDEYCERYATEAGAIAGHQEALKWLLDRLGPEAIDYIDYEAAGHLSSPQADHDFEDIRALANLILLQEISSRR